MKVQVTTKDGSQQYFNYYERYATGKYVVRFYVNDYFGKNAKKKTQWTGRGCTFSTIGEAVEFGTYVSKNLPSAGSQPVIKEFVNKLADYNKATANLEEFLCA